MAKKAKSQDDRVYQIKITLRGSKPPIWRRLEVRADTPLDRLHYIVQYAMGWTDSHMHQFIVGSAYYGVPMDEDFMPIKDERKFSLGDLAPALKKKIRYEYDFGDGWEHEIAVEKVLVSDALAVYPRCVAGAGNCPPEDCGGIWGFYNMLDAVKNPKHPEHADFKEWLGDEYDPTLFKADNVNAVLAELVPGRKRRSDRVWQFVGKPG